MRKLLTVALILLMAAPAGAWVITLTGGADNTLGNFSFPCTPKNGKATMVVPALGGAKTLTVRAYNSDNTAAYFPYYTGTGSGTAMTYTTVSGVQSWELQWGVASRLGETDRLGFNIAVSDNSALNKTVYIFGECN